MNNEGRKKLQEKINSLTVIKDEIDEILNEEQNKYDNMPESLQNSERGENLQTVIDELEEASSSVEEAVDTLTRVIE